VGPSCSQLYGRDTGLPIEDSLKLAHLTFLPNTSILRARSWGAHLHISHSLPALPDLGAPVLAYPKGFFAPASRLNCRAMQRRYKEESFWVCRCWLETCGLRPSLSSAALCPRCSRWQEKFGFPSPVQGQEEHPSASGAVLELAIIRSIEGILRLANGGTRWLMPALQRVPCSGAEPWHLARLAHGMAVSSSHRSHISRENVDFYATSRRRKASIYGSVAAGGGGGQRQSSIRNCTTPTNGMGIL
jgi:hypothetical protein